MKVQASVKTRCPHCKVVTRRKHGPAKGSKIKKVVYVICSANPRHRQRQG